MTISKKRSLAVLAIMILTGSEARVLAQSSANSPLAGDKSASGAKWRVQVDRVDPGGLNVEPAFIIAIYERLLDELAKTKYFTQVFRSGDRNAVGRPDVLTLKTTVASYTPGNETKRVVTTFTGATKLKVRIQLCKQDGQVLFDRLVDGNVRFLGSNLRATLNLAHNVAKTMKEAGVAPVEVSTK